MAEPSRESRTRAGVRAWYVAPIRETVTLDDGSDAGPVPAALVAVTVKVYGWPLIRPLTVQLVGLVGQVLASAEGGSGCAGARDWRRGGARRRAPNRGRRWRLRLWACRERWR